MCFYSTIKMGNIYKQYNRRPWSATTRYLHFFTLFRRNKNLSYKLINILKINKIYSNTLAIICNWFHKKKLKLSGRCSVVFIINIYSYNNIYVSYRSYLSELSELSYLSTNRFFVQFFRLKALSVEQNVMLTISWHISSVWSGSTGKKKCISTI